MKTVKVTLNLPEDLARRVKEESRRKNITMTDTIRKSLETELFLTKEEESGAKILLEKREGRMVQLIRR